MADPRYEIYGTEDIDLSWELGRLGYRCAVDNDVYVHHFRHRSVRASGLDFKKCLQENNRKFVAKWFATIAALLREREQDGEDLSQLMTSETDDSFRKLRRINANVGFWRDGNLVEPPDVAQPWPFRRSLYPAAGPSYSTWTWMTAPLPIFTASLKSFTYSGVRPSPSMTTAMTARSSSL